MKIRRTAAEIAEIREYISPGESVSIFRKKTPDEKFEEKLEDLEYISDLRKEFFRTTSLDQILRLDEIGVTSGELITHLESFAYEVTLSDDGYSDYINLSKNGKTIKTIFDGYELRLLEPEIPSKIKKITQNGITLIFFQIIGDEKYSFFIEGEEELTNQILGLVSTKRVTEKNIKYAVKGIFEKISEIINSPASAPANIESGTDNPIVELAEMCQKKWRRNLTTRVVGNSGPVHNPSITVEIVLPDGRVFTATAGNQKIAKQKAAAKALFQLF